MNRKSLGAVVATALLIVVSVLAVIGFQTWFQTYSSSIFTSAEHNSNSSFNDILLGITSENIYFKSDMNLNSIFVNDIDGNTICSFSNNSLSNVGLVGLWKFNDENSTIRDLSGNGNDGKLFGNTVLLMNFDDGTANDKTSYGNNGTIYGASWTNTDCISGGCYEFDGVGDYMIISENDVLDINENDFTISFWAKNNNISSYSRVLSKKDIDSMEVGWGIYYSSTYVFKVSNGTYYVQDAKVHPPNTNWNYIVFAFDRDVGVSSYLNGELFDFDSNYNIFYNQLLNSDKNFSIGVNELLDEYSFNGSLDELAIYSKALNYEEVEDLYNSRRAKFIEFKDSPFDKAVEFDGIDDYIKVDASSGDFEIESNLTIYNSFKVNSLSSQKQRIITRYPGTWGTIYSNNDYYYLFVDTTDDGGNWVHIQYNYYNFGDWISFVHTYDKNDITIDTLNYSYSKPEIYKLDLAGSQRNMFFGSTNSRTEFLNGSIDEIRIYNRTLSSSEIQALLEYSSIIKEDNLNYLNIDNCNLIKNNKYELMIITPNGINSNYFIAK